MAKVILRNGWWAPNAQLFRKSLTKKGPPVDIPDSLLDPDLPNMGLPSTAKLVPDSYEGLKPVESADTFSEHRKLLDANDPVRAAGAAEEEAKRKAEANRVKAAEKFQAELAAEVVEKPAKKGKK